VRNAFSALKQASWDDFNYTTLAEVEAQLKGAGPGSSGSGAPRQAMWVSAAWAAEL
jgi:hypothetical protein